jgi:hypothetical protein
MKKKLDLRHRKSGSLGARSAVALALLLPIFPNTVALSSPERTEAPILRPAEDPAFTREIIPPITVTSDGHSAVTKNGVHFDVFFNKGRKQSAVIYAINTGRKQLVLTPEKHRSILEDLIHRNFTVIVADFREKQLPGINLEHYIVQLSEDAREAADGILTQTGHLRPPVVERVPKTQSRTETVGNDYFTLMPGFTVERDIRWFRYADVPEAFRREIARQLEKPFNPEDGDKANTYDIIYPVYGPSVGVLTNYASSENGRQDYYPLKSMHLVMSFAFKNLAIVHQQYFNDPVGGYHKGYDYYGDQFATCFIRHLKGSAARYHIDTEKICCFGHSKGSEVPGMLLNKLRANAPFTHHKADFKKVALSQDEKTLPTPHPHLPSRIACAILGAGAANSELASHKMFPWDNGPAENISPFFLYSDHRESTRVATRNVIAKARTLGVFVDTAELDAHIWPSGAAYDQASAFADKMLRPEY